jgi:hypothetical protein
MGGYRQGQGEDVMSFAPTYYPGSPSSATAQRVKVGLGQEMAAIDVPLVIGRAATIRVSLSQELRGPVAP